MNNSSPTLNNVFTGLRDSTKTSHEANWETFKDKISKEVKGVKWTASASDIASKIAELLDLKIAGIFISCWKKSEELNKVIEESRKKPEEKFELHLSEHTISSEHKPYIEVRFKNAIIYKIVFDLKLSFNLEGFILNIKEGEIQKIDSGKCNAEGTLYWEGIKLMEKKLEPIILPAVLVPVR